MELCLKDISHFYNLSFDFMASAIIAVPINIEESFGEQEFNDDALFFGDYHGIVFPVSFRQGSGRKLTDILRIGCVWPFLISERLKHILEEHNFTGWKTFPVKVYDKNNVEIQGYYGFSVTGRCGPINYNKCEIIEKQILPEATLEKYYKGLYVGLDKWDGADFFLSAGYMGIIVTERVSDALKDSKLNVNFKNLAEFESSEFDVNVHINSMKRNNVLQ